jgi:eukaryotic-like serine/threonine-protein kinase
MPSAQNHEEALFTLALAKPADQRAAWLDRECEGNATLRQRLDALLAAHDQPEAIPTRPAEPVQTIKLEFAEEPPDEAIGRTLGRYKLLESIGEGGCGVVYVADQIEPVRRRVALKVIKLGMDTRAVVARFEAERQALAMMDHPNIAKVLDAGTTEQGRPYFVMELVRGIRITDYCDQNNLSTRERLDLFIKVCQAIQHAHQKGIIHRDIKPSNILVTLNDGVPVPKVIDFGIAKATEGGLTNKTVYTQLNQFIGTPAYMSPEQAEMSGLDIDTRSDIYSLGVLLYELLVGKTPFDARELIESGIDAMRKAIREKEPVRPSTKLATLSGEELTTAAKRRSVETSRLAHQLRGDLDWIVMKCLEKDRRRRYETANGLAFDLKRHLNNEPVLARPPSTAYRFQKAFRRNKLVFAAATAVFVALCLGVIATTLQSVRATRAKREALAAQAQEAIQRQKAVEAQAGETKLRQQAEAEELAARQRAYASDMRVAQQALGGNNLGNALDLLNRQRPGPGQKDLRGWEWRYLWQQTRSDALFTLCQESAEIYSLTASPDDNWLAIGGYHKGGLSIWNLRTGKMLARLAENDRRVQAAFSPTEPLLAFTSTIVSPSGEQKYILRLWNSASQQMAAEFPLDGFCNGLAFSKDGQELLTSTSQGLTLWRMPDGARLASYSLKHVGLELAITFAASPNLSVAACTLSNERIGIIDLHDGKTLWTAEAAKVFVTALAFSPDGKILATAAGFSESDIRLWDVATGKEIGQLEGHGNWVSALVFLADGKRLASCSADQTLRIWDVASRKSLDVMRGHRQEVWRLASLHNGKMLVSGAKDGTVCFWDTSFTHPRQLHVTIGENIENWCFVPDDRSVVTLDRLGQLSRWTGSDFQRQEPLLKIRVNADYKEFSRDGRFLAANSADGTFQIWDVSRGVLRFQGTNMTDYVARAHFLTNPNRFVALAWSGNTPILHEWDAATGTEMQSWRGPTAFLGTFSLSSDEQSCVAVDTEGEVMLRNLADKSTTNLDLDVLESSSTSYSSDGKLFTVASYFGYARVWDTANWRQKAQVGGFINGAQAVAFSPDSQRLAVASQGKEAVKLFDVESWQNVFTLEGEGYSSFTMAFSPDGNTIGWANMTGSLYLWRAPSWEEINAAEAREKAETRQP